MPSSVRTKEPRGIGTTPGTRVGGPSLRAGSTPRFVAFDADRMDREIQRQVLHAVRRRHWSSSCRRRSRPTDLDLALAKTLRKSGRPRFLMANKVDCPLTEWSCIASSVWARRALPGLRAPRRQTGDVLDAIVARLPPRRRAMIAPGSDADSGIRIAVVGRPNVGSRRWSTGSSAWSA